MVEKAGGSATTVRCGVEGGFGDLTFKFEGSVDKLVHFNGVFGQFIEDLVFMAKETAHKVGIFHT